jgi:hypothetical protein
MLKKLHAKISKWAQSGPRDRPKRQVRLGLEVLEKRDVPTTALYPELTASVGGTYNLFGLTANGQVEESTNSGASWFAVTGANTKATALVGGSNGLYMLASNGAPNETVYQYSGSGTNWTAVTGTNTKATALVDAQSGLYTLGSNGAANQTVYHYGGSGTNWTAVTGANTNATALVSDYGYVYMLGGNGPDNQTVWQYSGWGTNWTAVTGSNTNATALVATNSGLYMLASNGAPNETVYQYRGSGTNWTAVTGSNTQVFQLIAGSGNLYMVASNGGNPSVWQYAGSGTNWTALTGASLQNALAAWQLGLAHPMAAATYSPVSGTLFGPAGPSYLDVEQGAAADCWLLASLAETAARVPADIQNMFIYDGTTVENGSTVGVYSVRFYTSSGVAQYVTVDTELPGGGGTYDHPVGGSGAVNGSSSPVLWVALAEKAYAEANGAGFVTTQHVYCNSYAAVNFGDPVWALEAITGKPASDFNLNTNDVVNAWNSGKLVVLCTNTPSSSYIVGNHCYALVQSLYIPMQGQLFVLFNPWGTDANGWAPGHAGTIYGQFSAYAPFVSQNFTLESFGSGAAPPNSSLDSSGRSTTPSNHAHDSRLLDDVSYLESLFGAEGRLLEQSFGLPAAPGGQEGHHAWSSQQAADLVFTAALLALPSNT